MKTDIEIAKEARIERIADVAAGYGIGADDLEQYGKYKAKLSEAAYRAITAKPAGKLVLVTAVNPTPAGEGKTTTTIGLAMALNRLGKRAVCALREPSLGPCFGVKGGAAGGGYAQALPMEDINLHFTGDFHAITSANNLLAAMLDNHLQQGNGLGIDPRRVVWKRCADMNDRALRNVIVGLGGHGDGVPREDGFVITVASEVMAALCLAEDLADLRGRLARMIAAYTYDNKPVTARELKADGAMAALLKDAIQPNLAQTIENTLAVIHGGPFANIAHGCNSVRATKLAMALGEVCVTEAGFGADLGAEKFIDIKCRQSGIRPGAAVLVATVRALKYNGGVKKEDLTEPNEDAVRRGLCNLEKHTENLRRFGLPVVVALNHFYADTEAETDIVRQAAKGLGARFAVSRAFADGGAGAEELATETLAALDERSELRFAYADEAGLKEKIEAIAVNIYGAGSVTYTEAAKSAISRAKRQGFGRLPVCMAKTQYSLSDNPAALGRPEGFALSVRDVRVCAGAGFAVALTGEVMTMPGLPKSPAAERIGIDGDGGVEGLF